eukprot:NODE_2536_length_1040_cov_274.267251_g2518_i0.p1 GENE.NODE_2536_length_1040_cov_274.267251_g2518_i0~~NODE_2536_length_1040_cov_274.267251_g2518_i0.p1  ORF type:complete len:308 (+),score=68.87 NODE_2536_length_1040_cov_274.267251_g2518_i0:55-978(+)
MFRILVAAALVCAACAYHNPELVNEVNAKQSSWVAGHNEAFHGYTLERISSFMATTLRNVTEKTPVPEGFKAADSFSSAANWPNCKSMTQIRNQAECGSCWAFGAVEAFTDRYCVASNQKDNPILATEYVVSCDYMASGCNGGSLSGAWDFLKTSGTPLESCQPYNIPTCPPAQQPCTNFQPTPRCQKDCYGNGTMTKYHVESVFSAAGEAAMQKHISETGPIETAFTVYEDFLSYKSGVYHHTTGKVLGGHAVKVMGWGELNGVKYWEVSNSWTTSWGDQGYFKIRRGNDECGFEMQGMAGTPKLQ